MRLFDQNIPLFLQVKEDIVNLILTGAVQEDERIPSVREMAREYELNPNTVNSAIAELLNEEIIYKKRGIGMYVKAGALEMLRNQRRTRFVEEELRQLVENARRLGLGREELIELITSKYEVVK